MNFYQLEQDNFSDVGVRNRPKLPPSAGFLRGHSIKPDLIPDPLAFDLKLPADERMPHMITGGIVLFSSQLIDTIKSAGVDNFQTFPALLTDTRTGQTRDDYFAFNVVGIIDAVDMGKSDYDEIMGDGGGEMPPLVGFHDIVLSRAKIGDHKMFRLIQSASTLVVREEVVDALLRDKPEDGWGLDLIELDVV